MYTLTNAEREVTIRWDAEQRTATIDAAIPATVRKLDALAEQYPETYRLVSEDAAYGAKRYAVDARYIRFGKPPTEAQREKGKRLASNLRRETLGSTGTK